MSAAAAATPPPPPVSTEPLPKVGDLVMVDLANGYKMGVVKFVGTTEFQPGDWIGVALDQPKGMYLCSAAHGGHVLLLLDVCSVLSSLQGRVYSAAYQGKSALDSIRLPPVPVDASTVLCVCGGSTLVCVLPV